MTNKAPPIPASMVALSPSSSPSPLCDRRRPSTTIVRPYAFHSQAPSTRTKRPPAARVWVRFEALTRCEADFKPRIVTQRSPEMPSPADLDENPLRLADVGVHAVEGKVQHEAVTVAKAIRSWQRCRRFRR